MLAACFHWMDFEILNVDIVLHRTITSRDSCEVTSKSVCRRHICNLTVIECLALLQEHLKSIASTEDEQSVKMHTKSMEQEMKCATPSLEKLIDSMTRTFHARRRWVKEASPSMFELLQQYPALEKPELASFRCCVYLAVSVLLYCPASVISDLS